VLCLTKSTEKITR